MGYEKTEVIEKKKEIGLCMTTYPQKTQKTGKKSRTQQPVCFRLGEK